MPIFRNRSIFRVAQNITAFLNLDAGLIRGEVPDPDSVRARAEAQAEELQQTRVQLEKHREQLERSREELQQRDERIDSVRARAEAQAEELQQTRVQLEKHREQLERSREELQQRDRQISLLEERLSANGSGPQTDGVNAENIIWVFGTIRTGSTWLGSMMRDLKGCELWNEPRVGEMLGVFYYQRSAHRRENNNFILGLRYKRIWLKSIRNFVLDSVAARHPDLAEDSYLVIKEPSGSIGAPLLAQALPESRLILLVRDPRDAVASAVDSSREGSWTQQLKGNRKRREAMTNDPEALQDDASGKSADALVRKRANMYLRYVDNSRRAYESHDGPRTLVRYEDLLADTLGTMRRLYSELDIPFDEEDLNRVVKEHSWENIPEEEKGEGKFFRKATPGAWKEDLTPKQIGIVEEITAPLLEEFYSR